ncbi:hypothetical protein Taro_056918 [Colocasia esculenta]|uniref:Uncharacterized protein n=1 Tax=Colocasia esculenta TaxID=4460 RepID=A0A843XYT9_COLES|nr:hypothetical protein [Colocasia esculenta]
MSSASSSSSSSSLHIATPSCPSQGMFTLMGPPDTSMPEVVIEVLDQSPNDPKVKPMFDTKSLFK